MCDKVLPSLVTWISVISLRIHVSMGPTTLQLFPVLHYPSWQKPRKYSVTFGTQIQAPLYCTAGF